MSDFSTLLREYVTEQTERAQAVALDQASETRVVAWRARRRRAARVGVIAGAAAAVVIVAGAVVFAATRPDPMPPAEVQSPTPSPTPTAAPSEAADDDAPADVGIDVGHLLPAASPPEPGMLAAAGPGSFLVDYSVGCGHPCLEPASDPVLYLVGADGDIHEATSTHPAGTLLDWVPGTSVALFGRHYADDADGRTELVAVDLDTGETVAEVVDVDGVLLGMTDSAHLLLLVYPSDGAGDVAALQLVSLADGSVVASNQVDGGTRAVLSPDRSRILLTSASGVRVLETASLVDMALPTVRGLADRTCFGIGWAGVDAVVVGCPEATGTRALRVPLDGGVATHLLLHQSGLLVHHAWTVGGRIVLVPPTDLGDPDVPASGTASQLTFVVSRGNGLFDTTRVEWEAVGWSPTRVEYLGGHPGGVLVKAVRAGIEGEVVVLVDPVAGTTTTVLEPPAPGWGRLGRVIVVPSTDGGR